MGWRAQVLFLGVKRTPNGDYPLRGLTYDELNFGFGGYGWVSCPPFSRLSILALKPKKVSRSNETGWVKDKPKPSHPWRVRKEFGSLQPHVLKMTRTPKPTATDKPRRACFFPTCPHKKSGFGTDSSGASAMFRSTPVSSVYDSPAPEQGKDRTQKGFPQKGHASKPVRLSGFICSS